MRFEKKKRRPRHTTSDGIPRCQNCNGGPVTGGVCQACGHDTNRLPEQRWQPSTSLAHRYFKKTDPRYVEIQRLSFAKYGVEWKTWRDLVCQIGRLRGFAIRHGFRVDDALKAAIIERQLCLSLKRDPIDKIPPEVMAEGKIFEVAKALLNEKAYTAIMMWSLGNSHREIAQVNEWSEDYSRHAVARAQDALREHFTVK